MTTEPDPVKQLLDALAASPELCDAVKASAAGPLPAGEDAFWLSRVAIAIYGKAAEANAALTQIEARRHGKPADRVEHSGGLSVRVDPRDLSDEQLAAIVAGASSAKP